MKGFIGNIEQLSEAGQNFRQVLYTAKHSQLVIMSLKPGEDIGEEVHDVDQFFRIEAGHGKAVLDGVEHAIADGFAIVVPAGAKHNIINSADSEMKLYTIYSPANHRDGVVHASKEQGESDEEAFDGKTTE